MAMDSKCIGPLSFSWLHWLQLSLSHTACFGPAAKLITTTCEPWKGSLGSQRDTEKFSESYRKKGHNPSEKRLDPINTFELFSLLSQE